MPGKLSPALAGAYNEQYTDEATAWREAGGRYKAEHIDQLCRGRTFQKVLDCGAGEGSVLKFLDRAALGEELYAIEISDSGIAQIHNRNLPRLREVKKFDGYEIPYPDQCFDMAYCSHVLEHVEHPRILLRELKRTSALQVFEVPLDYSPGVDAYAQHFLDYGHINLYTPSLFKFLLRTEGFEIVAERRSHTAAEVMRYNWYHNLKRPKNLYSELRLTLEPLWQAMRRLGRGRAWYEEYGYSAYTCMTRNVGELRIFGSG
jgi:ubiquinone/menaquinone biosynthesis C-methylase UbiE